MRNILLITTLIILLLTLISPVASAIGFDDPEGTSPVATEKVTNSVASPAANATPATTVPATNYSDKKSETVTRGWQQPQQTVFSGESGRSINKETLKSLYEKAGKKYPADFSHAREALRNRDITSPTGEDYIAAGRRLPVVLQKSVRVNRQNIQKNKEAIEYTYKFASDNRMWLWILSIITAVLFLDRVLYWATGRGLFSRVRGSRYGYRP